MNIINPDCFELDPIEIDPRPCEWCCLTIDRHDRIDTPEGPEFFCADLSLDEMTLPELERRAELRRQEDIAAILARWEMLPVGNQLSRGPEPYRPAASTIDAFRYLVATGDVERIRGWLTERPIDAPYLLLLLEGQDHAQAL